MTSRAALLATLIVFAAAAAFLSPAQAAKETFDRSKPHVSIAASSTDLDLSGFRQMQGLAVLIESVEAPDPTSDERKRPGRTTYGNITLKRAYNGPSGVQDWATGGGVPLRTIHIDFLTKSAEPVGGVELIDCFPVQWKLETNGDGKLVESIELRVNRIEFKKA